MENIADKDDLMNCPILPGRYHKFETNVLIAG